MTSMVAIRVNSSKREELEATREWMLAVLYAPLLVAAVTVLALIVTLHLLYKQWLHDDHYRRFLLYIACLVTAAAFVACCWLAFSIRRKQMRVDLYQLTVLTPLLDATSLTPVYVDVEAPPVKPAAG